MATHETNKKRYTTPVILPLGEVSVSIGSSCHSGSSASGSCSNGSVASPACSSGGIADASCNKGCQPGASCVGGADPGTACTSGGTLDGIPLNCSEGASVCTV